MLLSSPAWCLYHQHKQITKEGRAPTEWKSPSAEVCLGPKIHIVISGSLHQESDYKKHRNATKE